MKQSWPTLHSREGAKADPAIFFAQQVAKHIFYAY
jgi:hypothetical protein